MNFEQALAWLKAGFKVRRKGWNGKGMWVAIQYPTDLSKMQSPYFYISPVDGKLRPWTPNTTDILAEDWEVVE